MSERNTGNSPQQTHAIAAELKRVREAAKLSQTQMAARLGLNYAPEGRTVSTGRATVSAWERGRRSPDERYLKVYVEIGGSADILLPTSAAEPVADPPSEVAQPSAETNSSTDTVATSVVASDTGAPEQMHRDRHPPSQPISARSRRRHRLIVVVGAVAAVAAIAIAVVVIVTSSSSDSTSRRTGSHSSGLPTSSSGAKSTTTGRPASTWTETTGTPAHTYSDATQLTGAGPPLGPRQSVQISCRKRGYVVEDGDPWWYRIESSPWNGRYYATSDAFYNNGAVTGPVDTGVVVDEQVPVCT